MKSVRSLVLAALFLLPFIAPAVADEVSFDGLDYRDATINGYRDGGLSVTLKGGEKHFDLSNVQWIALDASPDMLTAEKLRDKDPRAALASYQKAIRSLDDHDLKLLAELRAIAPADATGKWIDAVNYFLDVYLASPTPDVWKFRPTHFPAASSTMMPESAATIEHRLPAFTSDEAKKNLKTFQLEIYTKSNDPRADKLARELSGVPDESPTKLDNSPPTDDALVAPIEAALNAKDFAAALKQADAHLPSASDSLAIRLYQLQARAYAGLNKPDLEASTLLRIPTFYPATPEAPAALLVAADLQKQQNHPDEAKRLYQEIIAKYPDSPAAIRAKGG
ncbi:MAG TPA: tetratricopeptide repeat protein [Phycisphaerae bacterium]|nr:tetratricopeptide repeat protein [Phycisphaerae bacterium]